MDIKFDTLSVDCLEPEKSFEKTNLYSKDLIKDGTFLDLTLQENAPLCLQNQGTILSKGSIDPDNFCAKLNKLNISHCNLPDVPKVVFKYKYLIELNLSNNALKYLPDEIKNLKNLKSLNLSGNKLTSLPELLQHNHQLVYLNISHNNFIVVPDVLYCGLRMIEILDMSSNEIINFSEPPKCLNSLLELRLSDNKLEKVPKWIFDSPCQLQILDLDRNELKCEPIINYYNSKIFQTLRVLNIGNCNFRHESIWFLHHFKNIETLHMGNKYSKGQNYMETLKMDVFKNFTKLKKLSLNNVGLGFFPSGLYSFTNIESIDLSYNSLTWLPESFCDLVLLKILNLTSNELLFLPETIGNLVNLQEIYLGENQLSELPQTFINLTNLEIIDLYDNRIEIIDQDIILQKKLRGMDLGMNRLDPRNMENNSDPVWTRYHELKVSYRCRFHLSNIRSDVQMAVPLVHNTNEIIYDCSDAADSISDNYSVSSFGDASDSVVTNYNDVPKEELWEELSVPEVEKDNFFDPNANSYVSNTYNLYSAFERNYCPAYSNVRSLRLSLSGSCELNNVIEGQFDSD